MEDDKMELISAEEALQRFLLDIECLDELLPWTSKFNLFDVLKITRAEIRHSNMLSWLLDVNENHGLGDLFTKGIIQKLVENDSYGRYDVFKLLLMDFYSFTVYREWKNIDILLVSDEEKYLIAVENKVGSHEHSNQLNRYRKTLERDYADYEKIYIFLTPGGEEPSDLKNWDILTYSDVVDVLENLYANIKLQPDVSLIIKNYIEVVRRDIVEDQQLIDVCNKIYNKHKKALDLIYENRIDGRAQIAADIRDTLHVLSEEGKIIYKNDNSLSNTCFVFHTERMDDFLCPINEEISSWGSKNIYNYWISFSADKLCGYFELGGLNVPNAEMKKMQNVIDVLQPNDKRRENFRYKRVYRTKTFDTDKFENSDVDVDKAVRAIVDDIIKKEKELLNKLIKE